MASRFTIAKLASWRYRTRADGRDERLDLLRGFAIFAMVVDHFGGNSWLTPFTGSDRFLVSAAEGFVFLSGFVMGIVYSGRIARRGWITTAEAILRRAVVLYAVTVGLTLLFVGLFAFTDLRLWFDRAYGLGLTDPVELVVGTLTLHYTYHGTDILWMYTVLIAASPLLFHLLVTGRTGNLLLGSALLWLVYQIFPEQAAIPWVAGNAVNFPIPAWQLYFVVGLAMGCHRDRVAEWLGRVPCWPAFALSAVAFAALIVVDWGHATGRMAQWPLLGGVADQTWDWVFNKPSVSAGRIIAFAIAAIVYFLGVTLFWQPIHRAVGWLLLPLGQGALLAYGLHLIVIVLVYNADVWELYDQSRIANTLLQALTVGIVWGLVKSWHVVESVPNRLVELLEAPAGSNRQRIGIAIASAVLVGVTAGSAIFVGPVRGARPAASVEGEAGTLMFVPEEAPAGQASRILLVLRAETATAPSTAAPFVDSARRAGWLVIAPALDYGSWDSEENVRATALRLIPDLRKLLTGLDEFVEQPTQPRAFVYGAGRGGQLAHMLTLFYPELVRAAASAGAVPCTLPVESMGPGDATPLAFPAGLGNVSTYRGQPMDLVALGRVEFWIQTQPPRVDRSVQGCDWMDEPPDADDRLRQYTELLGQLGADVEVVPTVDGTGQAWRRALDFFEALPPD